MVVYLVVRGQGVKCPPQLSRICDIIAVFMIVDRLGVPSRLEVRYLLVDPRFIVISEYFKVSFNTGVHRNSFVS